MLFNFSIIAGVKQTEDIISSDVVFYIFWISVIQIFHDNKEKKFLISNDSFLIYGVRIIVYLHLISQVSFSNRLYVYVVLSSPSLPFFSLNIIRVIFLLSIGYWIFFYELPDIKKCSESETICLRLN